MQSARRAMWPTASITFLETLWSLHSQKGHVFLGTRHRHTQRWREHDLDLADDLHLEAFFARYTRKEYDLYFCPNRFRQTNRQKAYAYSTPFAWSDIDGGNPGNCHPSPNIVVETSPERFQALWIWNTRETPEDAELYSRTLTDFAEGDRNGWSVTKYLRVPGTYNHKPDYERPKVRLLKANWTPKSSRPKPSPLDHRFLAVPLSQVSEATDSAVVDFPGVFRKYSRAVHPRVRQLMRDKRVREPDRSKSVFEIVIGLFKAKAAPNEIRLVLQQNPYFVSKYGRSDQALHREVDRILGKLRGSQ